MVSILDLQARPDKADEPVVIRPKEEPSEDAASAFVESPSAAPNAEDFEFVVGRRQMASLLFVSTIVLMICVAAAYMAGKAMSGKVPASAASPVAAASVVQPDPPPINLNQE